MFVAVIGQCNFWHFYTEYRFSIIRKVIRGDLSVPPCARLAARSSFPRKNQPLQNKHRVIVHHVKRSSLFPQCPHRYTRVNCHRPRRQAAVAQGASRANQAPAQIHQMPQVFFCASLLAASAATPRPRCRGMFCVWASAPHALLCGVRVPATGHCACRYRVVELG